ncbi:PadR family transcriptional regulator [Herbiconiux sp. A18JL235]|uniref:PadR family transcriptional regulator n=1 Tax=Herbiconiux sp. A18JL235 TaxID=3152363 RepID=A0AB39BH99_9MICO
MRDPYLPLTETVAYTLLALVEPGHGYAVMARVESMSDGEVRLAPGTMYGALENLEKQKLIARVANADARRKVYQITELGYRTLARDAERMAHLVSLFENTRGDASARDEKEEQR